MHSVKVASADYAVDLATSAGGFHAVGVESYVPSVHIGGYVPVDPSSSSLSNALAPPPDRPRLRVLTASTALPDVQVQVKVKSESESGSEPHTRSSVSSETSSPGRTPSPPSPTSAPSDSPATPPEVLSDELNASEPEETTWALIPYDVPWGEDFMDYKAGELPGPEGSCLFLRSPTPVEKRRAAQACQLCRERKAKCSGERPCTRCIEKGMHCEYAPEPRRTSISSRESVVQPRRRASAGTTGVALTVHPYSPRTTKRPRLSKTRSYSLASSLYDAEVTARAAWDAMTSPASSTTEPESTWNSPYLNHFDRTMTDEPIPSTLYCGSYAFAETFAQSNGNTDSVAMQVDTQMHGAPVSVVTVGTSRSPDHVRQAVAISGPAGSIPLHAPRPCRRSPTPAFLSAVSAEAAYTSAASVHASAPPSSSSSQASGTATPSELMYPYSEDMSGQMQNAYGTLGGCKAQAEPVSADLPHVHSITLASQYVMNYIDASDPISIEPNPYILPSYALDSGSSTLVYDYSVGDGTYGFGVEPATTAALFAS